MEPTYDDIDFDDLDFEEDEYISSIFEVNDEVLAHYGVGHLDGGHSGRYPYGSGDNPNQHEIGLGKKISAMKKQGMSEREIAKALGFFNYKGEPSIKEMRIANAIESNNRKKKFLAEIPAMAERGMSKKEIAEATGLSMSSVNNYLNPNREIKIDKAARVAEMLKEELKTKHYLDVGAGTEYDAVADDGTAGVSRTMMETAIGMLRAEGYQYHKIKVPQLGNPGKETTVIALGEPDTKWAEVQNHPELVKTIQSYYRDTDEGPMNLRPIECIDSSRIKIHYGDQKDVDGFTGADREGIIQLRRGVEDLSLGKSMYSQVRIGVDGTHYLKGMAIYSDDIPDGYDVIYNTTKKSNVDKYDVFKELNTKKDENGNKVIDNDNPFSANIKEFNAGGQSYCLDQNGNPTGKLRAINKVNDQGDWGEWNTTISAQVLSKQSPSLIHERLGVTYADKLKEYDEICNLTNPTLKKKMLESFADDCDSAAAHLKAKGFDRQTTKVLIMIPSLKENEVYAPTYEQGETLQLIRFPHAHISEIPVVRVNNKNAEALKTMGNAPDAIGLNPKAFQQLSGADADGDTVVCIPKESVNLKTQKQFEELKNFDSKDYKIPKDEIHYRIDENGEKVKDDKRLMNPGCKQMEMGKITNLISDMQTIGGYKDDEIVKAMKHSMVVIDAVKHDLDYKQSEIDNDILALKEKYQNGHGASTFITRAGKEVRVDKRKLVSMPDPNDINPKTGKPKTYYGVDPVTGEKAYADSGEKYKKYSPTKKDPDRLVETNRQEEVPMALLPQYKDSRDLMSSRTNPSPVEVEYANYSNQMKALANQARLTMIHTKDSRRNPEAAKTYADEVAELKAAVAMAEKKAPRERQAQIAAGVIYKQRMEDNPEWKGDKERMKKEKGKALAAARKRMGVEKYSINITDRQWEAIQAGAVSATTMKSVFDNADQDMLKKRATPRATKVISQATINAIKNAPSNRSLDEIAKLYDVSPSTVSKIQNGTYNQ